MLPLKTICFIKAEIDNLESNIIEEVDEANEEKEQFQCNICGKEFTRNYQLSKHNLLAHEYCCKKCDKKFTKQVQLKRHHTSVHYRFFFHMDFLVVAHTG